MLGSESEDDSKNDAKGEYRVDTPAISSYEFSMLPMSPKSTTRFIPGALPPRKLEGEQVEQRKHQLEDAWRPLSHFIRKLCLTDLVYVCSHQIPVCVLKVLHQYSPETRLHMHTFSLRSLYQPRDKIHHIDPDEYLLATSPSIYSVVAYVSPYDTWGRLSYNSEALSAMIAGLAPNIKHLSVISIPAGDSIASRNARRAGRPPWQGFHGEGSNTPPTSKGHLKTLLCPSGSLDTWLSCTHPDELTTLKLHFGVSIGEVRTLTQVVQTTGLGSLQVLRLRLEPTWQEEETGQSMDPTSSTLIRALPPLKMLDLEGIFADDTLCAILDCHGKSFKELHLTPEVAYDAEADPFHLSEVHLSQMAANCPNLEKLKVVVRRTEGNQREVAIYRAFSKFERLKHLIAVLDCKIYDSRGPVRGENSSNLPSSIFRKALINGAIDSSLARDIFGLIRDEFNSIECLELLVGVKHGAKGWRDFEAEGVLHGVGQSWVCKHKRFGGEISVQEFGGGTGIRESAVLENDFYDRDSLRAVWTDLWPGPSGDRRGHWSSCALYRT